MPLFELIVEGHARETYVVEASSAAEARELWDAGEVTTPVHTEVTDVSLSGVGQVP